MGEDGCKWFQWAYDKWRDNTAPLGPPHTFGQHRKHQWTPSFETFMAPHHSPSHKSSCRPPTTLYPTHSCHKIQQSDDTSISQSVTCHHHTPSIEISLSPGKAKPLFYVRHHNLASCNIHESSPTPSVSTLGQCHCDTTVDCKSSSPRIWPFDFYANEMDVGFRKYALESNKHRPVRKVFQDHFHVKFVHFTFMIITNIGWVSASSFANSISSMGIWSVVIGSTFIQCEIKGKTSMDEL